MKVLVTGAAGLVGSAVTRWFAREGAAVVGVDNDTRLALFGPDGSVKPEMKSLHEHRPFVRLEHWDLRDSGRVSRLFAEHRFDAVVHCAGQPSHDFSRRHPDVDFALNVTVTHGLLEAARHWTPRAPFVYMSSNKVYGDYPNSLPLVERATRYTVTDFAYANGIAEDAPLNGVSRTPFGAHKAAADLMVQEYGRSFDMPTTCLRAGCITGASHAAVRQHGFLAFLVRCAVLGTLYEVFGYGGKQVRDNLAADDLARLIGMIVDRPRAGAVYNVGGGCANALSILEAFALVERVLNISPRWLLREEHRWGDHIWYVSDLSAVQRDYPQWTLSYDLEEIVLSIGDSINTRGAVRGCEAASRPATKRLARRVESRSTGTTRS